MSRRTFRGTLLALLSLSLGLVLPAASRAKELDPFTDRLVQLAYYGGGHATLAGAPTPAEVDGVLDREMNRLMNELQTMLNRERPADRQKRDELVAEVFQHALIPKLVTPYEEWVKHEAPVPLYRIRDKGIYGHHVDYDDMRLTWYIELSPIIQVAGVLMGIDKLGHFLGQGFEYYQRFMAQDKSMPDRKRLQALFEMGHREEVASLGVATTGIYSFADLAANLQGLLFHLALFDDVDVDGHRHRAYFARQDDGRYLQVRKFHWADWITADWDEAVNPSVVWEHRLYEKLRDNLWRRPGRPDATRPSICQQYRRDPQAYLGPAVALLPRSRYWRLPRGATLPPHVLSLAALCAQRPRPR